MASLIPGNPVPSDSLFEHRGFMRLWMARIAGTSASQMLMVAVGWQMYDLTGSAWDLGLVGLLQFMPALLLMLPAGHVVDQHHRARIVAVCLACQFTVAACLGVLSESAGTSRELLLGISVVLGALRAFQMPAQQALTPCLVPAVLLPRALAFSAAGLQAAIIAGPAIGGLLYVFGAGITYGVCAALFVAACGLTATIRYDHQPSTRDLNLGNLLAGLRFIAGRKVVLGAMLLDLFAVLLGGAVALLPIFAKDLLHAGPIGLGLLRAAPAVGAFSMSLWLTRRPIRRHTGRTLLIAVFVYGVSTVGFGWSTLLPLSIALLAIGGAADMVSVVIRQTLVQLETPDDMRGRVSSANSVFIGASNQLGEFESGATAAWVGPVASVVFGGVGTCLVALSWFRLFPALAQRDHLVRQDMSAPAKAS
jgi:MFS family permease